MALNLSPPSGYSEPSPETCHLLSLPRELRDEIFSLVVCRPYNIFYKIRERMTTYECDEPSLARTCRQVRDEALLLYYGRNRFTFFYGNGVPIMPARIHQIKHIDLKIYSQRPMLALDFGKGFGRYEAVATWSYEVNKSKFKVESIVKAHMEIWVAQGRTTLTKEMLKHLLRRLHWWAEKGRYNGRGFMSQYDLTIVLAQETSSKDVRMAIASKGRV